MPSLETYTGTVYGYPVRFVRWPVPDYLKGPARKAVEERPIVGVVLDDLWAALDLRPAVRRLVTNAFCFRNPSGWEQVQIGRKTFSSPIAEFARWIIEDAQVCGATGRRALAEYDAALAAATATLFPGAATGGTDE